MSLTPLTSHITHRLALAVTLVAFTGELTLPNHFTGLPSTESAPIADLAVPSATHEIARARVRDAYGQLPLSFEENHGQTAPEVQFLARAGGYTLFLTAQEAVLMLRRSGAPTSPHMARALPETATAVAVRMKLLGANSTPAVDGEEELPARSHYLLGDDPTQWRTDVVRYQKVKYEDVYPGVDLVYYGNQGQLEYDFIVNPGADTADISLTFEGLNDVRLDANGELVLTTGSAEIRQHRPVIYQDLNGVRTEIAGGYRLEGQNIGFHVARYDERLPLVIDPVLTYRSYLGGVNADVGLGIAVDWQGYAYVTGLTNSPDFPSTGNAYQPGKDPSPNSDMFVAKIDRDGTTLIYSTYLGGMGVDYGDDIAVDPQGHAYVIGRTGSSNFPTTVGVLQAVLGGPSDAFVTKLSRDGSALVYSTYLGGSSDDVGVSLALDQGGHVYAAGHTFSADFPTTADVVQSTKPGFDSGFVAKLDRNGRALVYSTYLGGSGFDIVESVSVDRHGHAHVTGLAGSSNFPTTSTAFQQNFGGGTFDTFVTKLNRRGSAFIYSTYLGGGGSDRAHGIAVDWEGYAYVTGATPSADFPTTSHAYQVSLAGLEDAFVTKLNRAGTGLIYSTYLGGSTGVYQGADTVTDIAVDHRGRAYVTGATSSRDFPTTDNALQPISAGFVNDAFLTTLSPGGTRLVYSTYMGGSDEDIAYAVAVDRWGHAYVTGVVTSLDFPVTANAFQPSPAGGGDAFVAKIKIDDSDDDDDPSIFYEIVSRNSDKCLDVAYASADARASVIQWICHGGANQQWRLEPVSDGAVRIIAHHGGQVLDVYGGLVDDVTPIIQFPWHGGDNQLWTVEPAANGYVFIVARHSGKVLDVERGSMDDGARVIQYTVHGGANQQWLLRAVAPAAPIATLSDREP